jgi:hypothetical protein
MSNDHHPKLACVPRLRVAAARPKSGHFEGLRLIQVKAHRPTLGHTFDGGRRAARSPLIGRPCYQHVWNARR